MNWNRTLVAELVGGIALWLASFVLHGLVMGSTYLKYPDVFTQTEANPFWFLLIEILIAVPAAILFAKTRRSWTGGVSGGLVFGFWLGLFGFFPQFFNPLIFEGFPYYMAWCWGGINMIVTLILGAVLGLIIKP